jgi:hypothetical protein
MSGGPSPDSVVNGTVRLIDPIIADFEIVSDELAELQALNLDNSDEE